MIKKYILSLVALCTSLASLANAPIESSPWKLRNIFEGSWSVEFMEAHYAEFKKVVFAKMEPSFANAFDQKYPQPSIEAIKELALYIDDILWCAESYPPQIIALIGSQKIGLVGDIACIVCDMGPTVGSKSITTG